MDNLNSANRMMELVSFISAKSGKEIEKVDKNSAFEHFEIKDIFGNIFKLYSDGSMSEMGFIASIEKRENEVLVRGYDYSSRLIVCKKN